MSYYCKLLGLIVVLTGIKLRTKISQYFVEDKSKFLAAWRLVINFLTRRKKKPIINAGGNFLPEVDTVHWNPGLANNIMFWESIKVINSQDKGLAADFRIRHLLNS